MGLEREKLVVDMERLEKSVRYHEKNAGADNTERAYGVQWQSYLNWCMANGLQALPADVDTICLYLTFLVEVRELSESTLIQTLSALRHHFRVEEGENNAAMHGRVKRVLKSLRRACAKAPNQKLPLQAKQLREIIDTVEQCALAAERPKWLRDKALLLTGWGGAFRRSELIALRWVDLVFKAEGVQFRIPESKTDQYRRGIWKGITRGQFSKYCPVVALERWRDLEPIGEWVFASMRQGLQPIGDDDVARIIKGYVDLMGWDPAKYAGHSLRRGWVTDATDLHIPQAVIMEQCGFAPRSLMTRRYYAPGAFLKGDTTRRMGL